MKKRFLSALLAMALALTLLPATALAERADSDVAYPVTGGSIYFDPATGTVTDADYEITAADIPAKINGVAVTSIGESAFYSCSSLTSVTIPASVTSIGDYAFGGCNSLPAISVAADNLNYCSKDGVLFNKAQTELIQYPIGKAGSSYAIPNGVTSIGDEAFSGCSSLTSVTIPNSVTSIEEYVFFCCINLTSVTIPNSVTSIGDHAFHECYNLTSVTIPDSVISIGELAFCGCDSLTSVTIPNSVISIGDGAFYSCENLTSVIIPDSVTSIGDEAFWSSGLTSVIIPGSVTSIGEDAFFCCESLTAISVAADNPCYCSKDGVLFNKAQTELIQYPGGKTGAYVIPDGITRIGDDAFCSCSDLTGITIPDSVTSIGDGAFVNTGLTHVDIPGSVTSIEGRAFEQCFSLTSVTVSASITDIGGYAFYRCEKLTDVYYGGSEEQWKAIRLTRLQGFAYHPSTDFADVGLGEATIHYNSTGPDVTDPQPQPPAVTFTDVKPGDWYAEAVQFAVDNGLMNGTGGGKFSPNGTTTRGQLMTILARMDGQDTSGGSVWYEKGMDWAKSKGISDGTNPTGVITREQLAAMLYRYADSPATSASLSQYPDAGKVSGYATDAMAWAVEQGIINGVSGNLAPQGTATRAQASTMIMRFCEKK